MAGFVSFYFLVQRHTTQTGWVLVSTGAFYWFCSFISGRSNKVSPNKADQVFQALGSWITFTCARLQPALCTWNYSLWKEKRRFLVHFPFFCTGHFFFLLFYPFPESVMFSSKLFTHKEVVRHWKNPSPALGCSNSPGSPHFLSWEFERWIWKLGESLPRQDLAFPSRWISQENWCLLMSCQGSRGHCYHRKLSLSSQGMWDIRGRGAGCWSQAGWEHPGGTSPEQLRSKGQLSLAVTFQCLLDRANDLRTAFTLGHCCSWCMQTLHSCSSPKVPGRKSSKPKTPVGVFKGFWVWDNDLQLIRWQGTRKDTAEPKPCESSPSLHLGRMCVGWRWGSKEDDLECAVKRNAKQTKNPLPSVHFDCSLKPYGLCFNYRTAKICFQSAFFVS